MSVKSETVAGLPGNYPLDLSPGEVKKRFHKLLGPIEKASCSLNLKVLRESVIGDGVVKQYIQYNVEENEIVSAIHLFKQDIAGDAPGVLSIHGHGGNEIFPEGKEFHAHPDPDDPMQYSYRAALEGFRVIAPDAKCFGERRTTWGSSTNFFDEIAVYTELTSLGSSLAWKSVWDNSRAIEVLEELGAKSIGVIGWSGGSAQAYILAAANNKVSAAVCFFSFLTLRHQFYKYRLQHCLYHFIPGMMKEGIDWDQVVALTAPRKLLLVWGAQDKGTPEPMYRAFVSAIKERCRREKLPESVFTCEEPDRGHEITPSMMEEAMEFFKRWISE